MQLIQYLEAKSLLPRQESWIGKFHSTERVFFWMFLGLLRRITLLAVYDVSAAFEIVGHSILLKCVERPFWCHGSPSLVVAFLPLWANSGSDFRVLRVSLNHGSS